MGACGRISFTSKAALSAIRRAPRIVGIARGIQWDQGDGLFIRLSTGTSLISDTSIRLSTAFQLYEQFMAQKNLGNLSIAVSYRHWSNASMKRPNLGMDFLGGHLEYKW